MEPLKHPPAPSEPALPAEPSASAAAECALDLVAAPGGGGPWNMALDEALARLSPAPALRVYSWPAAEATFGYSQSFAAARALAPGVPLTRRLTGGGLVRHGADITITLFLPRGTAAFPGQIRAGYRFLHSRLCAVLRELGVESELSPERPSGPVCFDAPVCDDLIRNESGVIVKIAGGAQRRLREGLLHQGSLNTPAFPPIRENLTRLGERLAAALAQALGGLSPRARKPSPEELALARRLCETRYASPAWNTAR